MDRLTEIGIRYGTDKADPHRFTEIYDRYLKEWNGRAVKLCEIGVAQGNSLRMWAEYLFPYCKLIGVDVVLPREFPFGCELVQKNQVDFIPRDKDLDVIIDDGSHFVDEQRQTFINLLPYIRPGGIYIVEDLQTSRLAEYGFNGNNSMINYLMFGMDVETKNLVDHVAVYNMIHEKGVSITGVVKRNKVRSRVNN